MDVAWTVAAVLFASSLALGMRLQSERARRKQQGLFSKWPVPMIDLEALHPVFSTGRLGPSLDTEVHFVGRGPLNVPGGTSDAEAWVLAVLAKRATHLFEFGTCTGKTAYLWSRNAAPGSLIATLTLAPAQQRTYTAVQGDSATDTRFALEESAFDRFLYSGTPAAHRITQLYGDSKSFDDTLWHDYAGPRHAAGVFGALNALARTVTLHHVRGTTFVTWRRPLERAAVHAAPSVQRQRVATA